MGIKFLCPNGHKLHVKSFLASQRGVCPHCGEKFIVPAQSLPELRVESIGVKRGRRGAQIELENATTLAEQVDLGGRVASVPRNGNAMVASVATAAKASSPLTDPLVEAPAAVWYVRIASGNQFGPAPADMMRRWIEEGRVAADSLVWREGWAEWAVAGRLFPQLSQPVASLPESGVGAITAFEQGLAEQVETLVVPTAVVADSAAAHALVTDSKPVKLGTLAARQKAKRRHKMALIALVVAIVCLLPVFFYVLMSQ